MLKRAATATLLAVTSVLTKPLGDAVASLFVGAGQVQQVIAIFLTVAVVGALLGLLETKRALGLNWWWHRFWYLHELRAHLRRELERELGTNGASSAAQSGPEIVVDGARRQLEPYVSRVLRESSETVPRLLVLGRPGSGKTTAAKYLTFDLASRAVMRLGFTRSMPVLLRMGGIRNESLVAYAATVMTLATNGRSGGVLAQGFDDLIRRGRVLLIIDAVDETPSSARDNVIKDIKALGSPAYARTPLVVTARADDVRAAEFPDLDFATVEIEDLSDPAVDAFIERYGRETPDVSAIPLREQLERSDLLAPRGLARNPFWLRLMLETGVVMNDRSQIVDQAVARVLSREWDERPDARRAWRRVRQRDDQLALTRKALAWLAYQMWVSDVRQLELEYARSVVADSLEIRAGVKDLSADDVLALGRDAQIVDYAPGADARLRFRHALLQDFFVATALDLEPGLLNAALIDTSSRQPSRWGALLMTHEIQQHANRTSAVAQLLRADRSEPHRVWLRAALFSSIDRWLASDEYAEALQAIEQGLASGLSDAQRSGAVELARIAPDRFAEIVTQLVQSSAPQTAGGAKALVAHAAGVLRDPRRAHLIAELLGAVDLRESVDLVVSFGPDVVPGVLEVATKSESLGQMRALEVLQRFGDSRTVEPLLALMERTSETQISWVLEALASTGDARVITPLVALIARDNTLVTMAALGALGTMGPIAIPALVGLLDSNVHGALASTMAESELEKAGPAASGALKAALRSTNEDVRWSAVRLLAKLADPAVADDLAAASRDTYLFVQSTAIEALGALGQAGLDRLLPLVRTTDLDQWRAAAVERGLRAIGSAAVAPLLEATTDIHTSVRQRAVQTLAALRDPAAVNRLGELLLEDPEPLVRFDAGVALGRIGDPDAGTPLLQAFETDQVPLVRIGALSGLARLGNAAAQNALFEAFKDFCGRNDSDKAVWAMRHVAARQLVDLHDGRVVEPLQDLIGRGGAHKAGRAAVSGLQRLLDVATGKNAVE